MRMLILVSFLLVGCHEEPKQEVPKEEPVKTRPNIRRPPTRMIASESKPVVIAVIDTGFAAERFGYKEFEKIKLCKYGHKDFSGFEEFIFSLRTNDPVPVDNHGHGTNIACIIDQLARTGTRDYCLVILKYYDPKGGEKDNLKNSNKAMRHAIDIKADYVNYSGGGTEKNKTESKLVKEFLDKGGVFVAAAGNERSDLQRHPYYPASVDPRVISVGNLSRIDEKPVPTSNYGKAVKRWEIGDSVVGCNIVLSGTSQAAATATGKMIKDLK